jgi:acyl-CoA thioester hydrolase
MPQLVYTSEIQVRWGDMDAFGHVNNSKFFSYFETARVNWWQEAVPEGLDLSESGPVLVNANCTFMKPVIFPETLLIEISVGPGGRSSHECFYTVLSKKDTSVMYAEGTTKVVWVDRRTGKSVPLPDMIRKLLPES